MKAIFQLLGLCICILCVACAGESKTTESNKTQESFPDWPGTYLGTVPCADCAGIETNLTLNRNTSFILRTTYLGKSDDVIERRGVFTIDSTNRKIMLQGITERPAQYLLGQNTLTQLDIQGKRITGPLADQYILKRTAASELAGIRWNLDVLMGKDIPMNPAYIMFDIQRERIGGYGWCNAYNAHLDLQDSRQMVISAIDAGKNICADSTLEMQFFGMLGAINHFQIEDDRLYLYRVEDAPLAELRKTELRAPPMQ